MKKFLVYVSVLVMLVVTTTGCANTGTHTKPHMTTVPEPGYGRTTTDEYGNPLTHNNPNVNNGIVREDDGIVRSPAAVR